jgi:low temperature requirement protein LtrA
MWWIYFSIGAERGSRLIASSADPGRVARLAYTYLHLPIVGGIIVAAVADELVLVHPTGHTDLKMMAAVLGGPALYLVGNILFKRATAGRIPLSHLGGLLLLALLAPLSLAFSPLVFGTAAMLVLVVVAIWEWVSLGPSLAATSHV